MFKKKKDQTYQSYWSISWNIFKKNKVAMVCLFIVILLCLIALFAPLIAPYDPNKQVLTDRLMKPCGQHWFGTDDLGRDIFSRIIYGCRVSLSVGIISQIIATVIGYTMGVCAGYYGGKVDSVISFLIQVFSSFPFLLFAVSALTISGNRRIGKNFVLIVNSNPTPMMQIMAGTPQIKLFTALLTDCISSNINQTSFKFLLLICICSYIIDIYSLRSMLP